MVTGTVTRHAPESDVAAIARIKVVPTILEVLCGATGMGFSAVARVTDERWIACAVRDEIDFGLVPGGELELETTICNEIRQSGQLVVIDDCAHDEVFRDHHTPKQYGFQSYISVPIRLPDGRFFGTLCAIDPRPARLNNSQTINMFTLFADLIALQLDAQERLSVSETALVDQRESAELQDQFVAVLGHDLRNPLSAIQTGAQLLMKMGLDDKAAHLAQVIDRSAKRMTGLIDEVLDFARSRLGGGLSLNLSDDSDLQPMLEQVVAEMRTAQPDRTIHSDIALRRPVVCDRARMGQLLSNLLANALTHGLAEGPVWVRAHSDDACFELSVANLGEPIPPDTITRLFRPYARGSDRADRQGLGLGLYIASEIARAHGGSLDVSSTRQETRFTFCMPVARDHA
jgi:signal transduction histidine kinase